MLNDQKLGNYQEVSNRTNQLQIQVVRERRDPLLRMTRELSKKEEKRPVLRRSMLVLFAKNLVLQSERGDLLRQRLNPTRSSDDRKDFNVEQTRERTERPVNTHDMTNVSDISQTRSAHESKTFNVEDEILRKRTERSVADHDVSHKSIMVNEAYMDFRIPGLPHIPL